MTPVKQKNPLECFRACLASLLDQMIQTVPDFFEGLPPGAPLDTHAYARMQNWLASDGMVLLPVIIPITDPVKFTGHIKNYYHDVHYIQIGQTRKGLVHAVIGRNGAIIHDPAPVGQGGLEPVNRFYHICFIGRLL